MKKNLLMFLSALAIATVASASNYVLIVYSEPFSQVFVNGEYVGMVDITGKIEISLDSSGKFIVTVEKSWYLPFEGEIIITSPGKYFVFAHLREAGAIRVFSNVYPLEVFSEGMYLGKIYSVKDVLYAPAGTVTLTFRAEGYKEKTVTLHITPRSERTVNIFLEEKELELNLKIEPETFSPNGDWYNDTTNFYIYLSKPAHLKIEVFDYQGTVVWTREIEGSEGTNRIVWNGKDVPDGRYRVKVTAITDTEIQSVEQEVKIDRSEYTYFKEIFIGSTLMAVLLLLLIH
ncbi:FlgD immunoglobulin-like domain containing protein [Thermotoga sp. KOL6]|uniref:FlgD immunoglobulin-like domain containing protein n=1 Tax=Thermotoga sp. KOL6 TaxID=126741 RepID=UPI000C772F59|nr:FlgD immunoglobulin-like domain containing protein [Thermotoga sp. KOL6]PLV59425.1 flagellar biosynthesis protein FlgD [Thermotoga sp. KOL6]